MERKELEKRIGYRFIIQKLLIQALTHSSAGAANNERLEFLGDAVLELFTSEYLFDKYPNENEGVLTRKRSEMVRESSLAFCAKELGIGDFLILGKVIVI